MSSETSTDHSGFRPWHFFVLGALAAATAGVVVSRNAEPAATVLLSLAIGAAALVGMALQQTLWPLAAADRGVEPELQSRRVQAALEREKALVLRSIKELEFDRAMGKVAESDFQEMAGRLRLRAINLMRQLEGDASGYRELIERELRTRLAAGLTQPKYVAAAPATTSAARERCDACETANDADAKFCKNCGTALT